MSGTLKFGEESGSRGGRYFKYRPPLFPRCTDQTHHWPAQPHGIAKHWRAVPLRGSTHRQLQVVIVAFSRRMLVLGAARVSRDRSPVHRLPVPWYCRSVPRGRGRRMRSSSICSVLRNRRPMIDRLRLTLLKHHFSCTTSSCRRRHGHRQHLARHLPASSGRRQRRRGCWTLYIQPRTHPVRRHEPPLMQVSACRLLPLCGDRSGSRRSTSACCLIIIRLSGQLKQIFSPLPPRHSSLGALAGAILRPRPV